MVVVTPVDIALDCKAMRATAVLSSAARRQVATAPVLLYPWFKEEVRFDRLPERGPSGL